MIILAFLLNLYSLFYLEELLPPEPPLELFPELPLLFPDLLEEELEPEADELELDDFESLAEDEELDFALEEDAAALVFDSLPIPNADFTAPATADTAFPTPFAIALPTLFIPLAILSAALDKPDDLTAPSIDLLNAPLVAKFSKAPPGNAAATIFPAELNGFKLSTCLLIYPDNLSDTACSEKILADSFWVFIPY